VGHGAVYKWATDLGQKYVRMQLSKHLITIVWEHVEFNSKMITASHAGMNSLPQDTVYAWKEILSQHRIRH